MPVFITINDLTSAGVCPDGIRLCNRYWPEGRAEICHENVQKLAKFFVWSSPAAKLLSLNGGRLYRELVYAPHLPKDFLESVAHRKYSAYIFTCILLAEQEEIEEIRECR